MLRERYYKRFSVWVKIIAYNAIIILCHLVKFAIFAVTNFFSLLGIAVFNIPITHIIMFLLFLMQRYNLFSYLQIFFNFFHFWRLDLPTITNFVFTLSRVPPFSGCRVPAVFRVQCCAGRGRVSRGVLTIIRTRIHTRIHTYARDNF